MAATCRQNPAAAGLEKAKRVVCVSDGAVSIWNLMFMCFAYRIEILDSAACRAAPARRLPTPACLPKKPKRG